MRRTTLALLAVAALMTASCAGDESTTSSQSGLFFPTWRDQPEDPMSDVYRRPLVVRNGCVQAGVIFHYVLPIWPKGFSAERDESARLVVRDDEGAVVAVEGRRFEMAGGYIAEFGHQGTVEARDGQLREIEESLGSPIPERCLDPDVDGVWSVQT